MAKKFGGGAGPPWPLCAPTILIYLVSEKYFVRFWNTKELATYEDTCYTYGEYLEIKNNRIFERLKYEIAILTGNDVDDDNDYELW